MSYTMQDFIRDYFKEEVEKLTPEERRDLLKTIPQEERIQSLHSAPLEARLAGISTEELQRYVENIKGQNPKKTTKARKKK